MQRVTLYTRGGYPGNGPTPGRGPPRSPGRKSQMKLSAIRKNPNNPRQIRGEQFERLKKSIQEFPQMMALRPIVVDADGVTLGGNMRLEALKALGFKDIPDEWVKRADELTEEQKREFVVKDNSGFGDWDWDALANSWSELPLMEWGVDLPEDWLQGNGHKEEDEGAVSEMADRAAELQEKWRTETGQLWEIGQHRLIVGDCTVPDDVRRLMRNDTVDALVTDPPYCSGGFQEAGKKSGSIGTRGTEMIANDTLSTRGYTSLIKSVLSGVNAGVIYIFTDWRMWVNLYDVAESSGYGVRNMVVWDKGTPGMGRGWRSQHELILCGMKVTQPFDPKKAQGNVIKCDRTGNVNHPTEKPVELIEKLLDVTDMARVIYEPFCGSGTTMVACESMGRECRALELSPAFAAVTLERMSALGLTPELQE